MAEPPRAFVVGHPIAHSRSPLIHGWWLRSHGLAGRYEAVDVAPAGFQAFIAALKSGDGPYLGGNVTIPHKAEACRLADRVDPLAEEIGAANTLWREDGVLNAINTDVYGFLANLDQARPGWCAAGRPAVVYGAGGASRAVVRALIERGHGTIHLLNRTVERARELADRFGPAVVAHPAAAVDEVLAGAGLFVNTTSLGMGGGEVPAIDFSRLDTDATVTDIVYVPLKTPFLRMAEAAGRQTVDGLGMLLHQAVPGFEKWFGMRPAVTEELRRAVIADMEAAP